MFFLDQIKTQFLSQIALYQEAVGENGGGNDDFLNQELSLEGIDKELAYLEGGTISASKALEAKLRFIERELPKMSEAEKAEDKGEIDRILKSIMSLRKKLEEFKQAGQAIDRGLQEASLKQDIKEARSAIAEMKSKESLSDSDYPKEELELMVQELQQKETENKTLSSDIGAILVGLKPEQKTKAIEDIEVRYQEIETGDTKGESTVEKLDITRMKNKQLLEIKFDLETTLSDETKVGENGETLGDVRGKKHEELFADLVKNATKEQKEIIGDKKFSELRISDITALHEVGLDLSTFFLVDIKGKSFEGDFSDNQELIFNAGGRDDIAGYITGYIIDAKQVSSIIVNGVQYIRDTKEKSDGFVDIQGNPLLLKDGQKIVIEKTETLSPEGVKQIEDQLQSSYGIDRGGDVYQDMMQSGVNGFSLGTFIKSLFSGDVKLLLEQLEYLKNGKFQVDMESGELSQYNDVSGEYVPVSAEDLKSASLSNFPQSYRANLIKSCRKNGIDHTRFVDEMNKECQAKGVPPARFIALIGHESGWKSWAQNPNSSAYGLGQMIDSTWSKFANGGDRHNPIDQMKASIAYVSYIMRVRGCSPEDACAFYNTGEGFKINNSPAPSSYVRTNGVIVNKIPSSLKGDGVSSREYFIGAVSYYNDISFEEAKSRSRFG